MAKDTTPESVGSIHVVADGSFPPLMFVDAKGGPQGYEADIWRLFEKYTGIQVKLELTTWTQAQQAVLTGQADVLDMIMKTADRVKTYELTQPFLELRQGVYTSKGLQNIKSIDDLKGISVGVEAHDVCEEYLANKDIKTLRSYQDYQDVIQAAADGEIQAFCVDQYSANYFLGQYSAAQNYSLAFEVTHRELHRAVLPENKALVAIINTGMAKIPSAEIEQVRQRWLTEPLNWRYYLKIVAYVCVGIFALALFLLLWAWMLRRRVVSKTYELRTQKSNLRALFKASPDAIWLENLQGQIQAANDQVIKIFNINKNQLLGQNTKDLFSTALARQLHAHDQKIIDSGQSQTFLINLKDTQQKDRYYEVIKAAVYGDGNEMTGLIANIREVTERQNMQQRLQLWVHSFKKASLGMAICDLSTWRFLEVSPTFAKERGYQPEEMVGMDIAVIYPLGLADEQTLRPHVYRHDHVVMESEHVTRQGVRFPVEIDCSVVRNKQGEAVSAIVYAQDITQRKQNERELRLSAVSFQSQAALLVTDANYAVQRINQSFTQLTGFEQEDLVGQHVSFLNSHYHDQVFYKRIRETVAQQGVWRGERWITVKQGQPKITSLALSAVADNKGQISHYVFSFIDLTDKHKVKEDESRQTHFDGLTGLPNRRYLQGLLEYLLEHADVEQTTGVLLLVNINHFKRVNDLHGHSVGDALLKQVATRLNQLFESEYCVVARFIGNSFAVLSHQENKVLTAEQAQNEAKILCDKIGRSLAQPFDLGVNVPINLTASLGWTEITAKDKNTRGLLKEVELAAHNAKLSNKPVLRFESYMQEDLERQEQQVHELRKAVEQGAFELYLQSQVNAKGEVKGAEALLRWPQPNGQFISPAEFIPIAEENGLIQQLGQWVLQQACDILIRWSRSADTKNLVLAVNVSAIQFAQTNFVANVQNLLRDTGVDPSRLKIEITETALLNELSESARKLQQLQGLGIHISLDDFGTGHSSLSYIAKLPINQLKIDKSFIDHVHVDKTSAMVVETIINLGLGLGLEVVAEGVELESQLNFLESYRCDTYQGYLFAKPVPESEFLNNLHAQQQ